VLVTFVDWGFCEYFKILAANKVVFSTPLFWLTSPSVSAHVLAAFFFFFFLFLLPLENHLLRNTQARSGKLIWPGFRIKLSPKPAS